MKSCSQIIGIVGASLWLALAWTPAHAKDVITWGWIDNAPGSMPTVLLKAD